MDTPRLREDGWGFNMWLSWEPFPAQLSRGENGSMGVCMEMFI